MDDVVRLALAGLGTGAIYALVALGFNIVFKSTDALNFAQGEWVMAGGMVAATLYAAGLALWLACGVAIAVVTLFAILCERLVVRRLARPTPLTLTVLTIGLALATKSLVMLTLGKNPAGLPEFSPDFVVRGTGLAIPGQLVWILAVAALVLAGTSWFFSRTIVGKSMRAAAAEPEAAALVGIDPRLTLSIAFAFAGAIGAVAGIIITPLTLTSFDHGTLLGFKGFCAAMTGGLGSLPGALLGGLVLGLVESLAGGLLSSHFKDAFAFAVLLAVLVFRPAGLLGRGRVERI